ncbi:GLPGLI family protein [Chryseobacterium indologenes]|uniref:GLPGLI family protein n=1 Tax=Chryseobacterium indologenes TaxID=253 RepID=UPI001BCF618C|nr:GLPGLI family protein [Chryseobacterium indologenes]
MRNLFLLISFISSFVYGQNMRFIYNYTSIPDSLNKSNVINEITVLELDKKGGKSIFSSLKKIISDSTMQVNAAKGVYTFPDPLIKTQYVIEKDIVKKDLFFYTQNHTINPVFKVEDKRKIDWEILKEKKQILSYPVQKATTVFGGRKWIAWFSTDIPFQDGPYKFNGLPGLILQICDATNSHCYNLIGISKLQNNSYKTLEDNSYIGSKTISLEQYIDTVKEFKSDPMKSIRQKIFRNEIFFTNEQQKSEYLKNVEKELKQELSENNNPIELNQKVEFK